MSVHEVFQTALNVATQTKELFDAGYRANLLQTLSEAGHPYGLLLGMSANSWPSILLCPSASSSLSAEWSGNSTAPDPLSSLPFSGLSSANFSLINSMLFNRLLKRRANRYDHPEAGESWAAEGYNDLNFSKRLGRRLEFSSDFTHGGGFEAASYGLILTLFSKSALKWLANHNEAFNNFWNSQAVLAPGILKSLTELSERPRKLWVSRNQIGLGTSSIYLGKYRGESPYIVRSLSGDQLSQINPGETLGSVHVSGQARLLRKLSPLEKVEKITEDFIDLFKAINLGASPDLNEIQRKTLANASQATIIGVSHLVRLFGRKTGLPTWKLDILPELVQKFHQQDSQAVSTAFGGTRKVKSSDIEIMIITPAMRLALAENFA